MATTHVAAHESKTPVEPQRVVNDLSIQVATVNGSGSQTANTVLLRAIFQMGIPGVGQESLSLEYRRPADLVHHSRFASTATSPAAKRSISWWP